MTELEQDLAPDRSICINCGAPLSFRVRHDDSEDALLDQAKCEYCEVLNDRALAELRKQRARDRHAELEAQARRRKILVLTAGAAAAVLLVAMVAAFSTQSALNRALAEVERSHAQLVNVRERQEVVVRQWGTMPPGPDRDAELSGAENRVRIERARYDEAAAAYNARVGATWPSIVARIFGLPTRARLSDDPHW
jgi:hypothetical protein